MSDDRIALAGDGPPVTEQQKMHAAWDAALIEAGGVADTINSSFFEAGWKAAIKHEREQSIKLADALDELLRDGREALTRFQDHIGRNRESSTPKEE